MKIRRDKGLCYNCEDRYSSGHRCKVQKLYLLDGFQVEEEIPDQEVEQNEEETGVLQAKDSLEISLHAISGTLAPLTMRLKGTINRHSVIVLIDSGSTHNFIDTVTARKTGVKIQGKGSMEVMVANRERLNS